MLYGNETSQKPSLNSEEHPRDPPLHESMPWPWRETSSGEGWKFNQNYYLLGRVQPLIEIFDWMAESPTHRQPFRVLPFDPQENFASTLMF